MIYSFRRIYKHMVNTLLNIRKQKWPQMLQTFLCICRLNPRYDISTCRNLWVKRTEWAFNRFLVQIHKLHTDRSRTDVNGNAICGSNRLLSLFGWQIHLMPCDTGKLFFLQPYRDIPIYNVLAAFYKTASILIPYQTPVTASFHAAVSCKDMSCRSQYLIQIISFITFDLFCSVYSYIYH